MEEGTGKNVERVWRKQDGRVKKRKRRERETEREGEIDR